MAPSKGMVTGLARLDANELSTQQQAMANPLVFQLAGRTIKFDLAKVGRDKLYGYKEVEACDDQDRACQMVTLADDGQTVVGSGGIALAQLTADKRWCDKGSLRPVDANGQELAPVPSSFAAPIPLEHRVSTDTYLEHNIRAVYHLQAFQEGNQEADLQQLQQELNQGAVFTFPFSYRGGLTPDVGFLLTNAEGEPFLALGTPNDIRLIGLQETAEVADPESQESGDEDDLMDFDMI